MIYFFFNQSEWVHFWWQHMQGGLQPEYQEVLPADKWSEGGKSLAGWAVWKRVQVWWVAVSWSSASVSIISSRIWCQVQGNNIQHSVFLSIECVIFLKTADDATCKQYCSTDVDIPSSCLVYNFEGKIISDSSKFRAILSAVVIASAGLRAVFVQSSISVK